MNVYVEHIYSLKEKPESDISPLWKILQIVFYMCCIGIGLAICYNFGNILNLMQSNCILNAKIRFEENDFNQKQNLTNNIKIVHSEFHTVYCDLIIYIPVTITIFASFFMVLFAICGRGGLGNRNLPHTWRIVLPTILFNLTCFCLSMYSASTFHRGLASFLHSVATAKGVENSELSELNDLRLEGKEVGGKLRQYLLTTKHTMWMLVTFWGLNFFWILLRCIFNVDFQLVRTTVHVYPKSLDIIHKSVDESQEKPSLFISDTLSEYNPENISHSKYPITQDSSVKFRSVQFDLSTQDVSNSEPKETKFKDASTVTSSFIIGSEVSEPPKKDS